MTSQSRQQPPAPLEDISFSISRPVEFSLDNGLRVIVFAEDRLPLVSFRLAFHSGDAHDPPDHRGITSAMAALLTEGTRNNSSRQLAERVERLGASINASASDDFTIVSASALSLYASEILRLVSEVVLTPTFPEEELDLYRRNTVEHLRFQRSQPSFLANEQVARLIYGDHPYSVIAPAPTDIEKLEQQTIAEFHRERMLPSNATMIIAGDVLAEELERELDDLLGGWNGGQWDEPKFPELPRRTERTLTIVDRPGSAQSNIVLANAGISRTDPDYFPLLVMNQVLGAGASSRVFMNLREEKGYTYGAYTRLDTKKLAGVFEATAEVRTAVTGDSIKEFFYELERIRSENVAEEELQDAKNFLTGVFPIRAETQEGLTNLLVSQFLYGLPKDYLDTYRHKIQAVTSEDVRRVAERHVRPDEMAMVIVGDAADVLSQAANYASDVSIVDTNGEPQPLSRYESVPGPPADANGRWNLQIDLQGQQVPFVLTVNQRDDHFNGSLESTLGSAQIVDGAIKGNRLSAVAKAEFQGQVLELIVNGNISEGAIVGTVTAPIAPEPLPFTGTRDQAASSST
jgi:zinc protease